MHLVRFAAIVALIVSLASSLVPRVSATVQRSDAGIAEEVRRELSRVRDLRRVTVSVSGSRVTLSGPVNTLWLKNDAIRRAGAVDGVATVVSEMTLPRAENDARLAQQVGRAIDRYPQASVFDYVAGVVQDGIVTLTGSVTAEGRKADDIATAVSRVRGVQEIRNEILTLPPSLEDDRIRVAIYRGLLSNIHLEPLARIGRPSFYIVVHNSVVSLYGFVPGEIEYRQFEMVARETLGVLRVHNHLQTTARPR
jgi:osmotically-inducible protein OsmY